MDKSLKFSEIAKQEQVHGISGNTHLLRYFLDVVKTESQWICFTDKYQSTDEITDEVDCFYVAKPELASLCTGYVPMKGKHLPPPPQLRIYQPKPSLKEKIAKFDEDRYGSN